ncbi:hypothetical protein GQ57_00705 [Burkholderia sp. MSh2]|uniref:Uncharacterized protein n=1 Tax=Burkholderia paludis TaxID=1506587 RepID=A0A6J5D5R2_9BURK|nr:MULTISPECIES: DUF5682 family protein [Burkholderia]KEZ07628.1 hypothetical protein GQ57_00705 [Burkholderia sp. MSh2]KFG98983.1 hypothetical protein GQ56_0100505 [Burkholderia paludis]CAB3749719.1 hypothetical protein LMG30113_01048 [Burkholderia paludis]VWB15766.1 hypothetical protein BPA30113_00446 [Burkholderia paludis]
MAVRYYGIRHHGPGCARALNAALAAQQPDVVLLEGPPEADAIVALAGDAAMRPPVALLVYPSEAPRLGAFYPFAEFSPEWQAIRHATTHNVPLWFMDLPATHGFAESLAQEAAAEGASTAGDIAIDADAEEGACPSPEKPDDALPPAWRMDPIGELSRAAGYDDHESWWEVEVEQRRDAGELFAAIEEAMVALREHAPAPPPREARREAHMRMRVREAQKAGYQSIAVVCGAWHIPALTQAARIKDDTALLKGLPKTRTEATWVPWSDDRLSYVGGYGAGVESPGWYRHLWQNPDSAGLRWVTECARMMRAEGLDVSSASVIETVRLADALAAMRDLPLPGLAEQREAMMTVLCHGQAETLSLIRRKLEIGEQLGSVPESVLAAPLQRDLDACQKRLRFKPTTEIRQIDLDLREDGGRQRSVLLHRLNLLDVAWGSLLRDNNRTGTFRETWELRWQPDMVVALIATSRYGNTIEDAATHRLCERARAGAELPQLTGMLDQAVLARLPVAIDVLLACVQTQAAVAADLAHLMTALPPLARVVRYGDVRGTTGTDLEPIVEGLVERIVVGLAAAASCIDEAAATGMLAHLDGVQGALDTLDIATLRDDWLDCLVNLTADDAVAPVVRGFALRLAFDRQRIDTEELARQAGLALAAAVPPADSTGWLTGLLRGSGLLLLQQDALWRVIDTWLAGLPHDVFLDRLPLLRRAFADFHAAERREMGGKVRRLDTPAMAAAAVVELDHARAARVLPVLAAILGK